MTESQLLSFLAIFLAGAMIGVLATLLFNKVRSGKASAGAVKQEFDDYQSKVEEHFDETSEKFKAMAEQYKDLYQHLSVGATSLCRPEHVVAGLNDQTDPLQPLPKPKTEVETGRSSVKTAGSLNSKSSSKTKLGVHTTEKVPNAETKQYSAAKTKSKKSSSQLHKETEVAEGNGSEANMKKTDVKSTTDISKNT